jgi:hypothetical protein
MVARAEAMRPHDSVLVKEPRVVGPFFVLEPRVEE